MLNRTDHLSIFPHVYTFHIHVQKVRYSQTLNFKSLLSISLTLFICMLLTYKKKQQQQSLPTSRINFIKLELHESGKTVRADSSVHQGMTSPKILIMHNCRFKHFKLYGQCTFSNMEIEKQRQKSWSHSAFLLLLVLYALDNVRQAP